MRSSGPAVPFGVAVGWEPTDQEVEDDLGLPLTPPPGAHGSPRIVEFAGYTWQVKASAGAVDPGPNHFIDSPDNVWVDDRGRLHLAITDSEDRWNCAEVITTQSLGSGRYTFELDSDVSDLDPNVVLGLFTWSDDPAYNHREMDIEFSRWANAGDPTNGQYVVQPYDRIGNLQRIVQPPVASSAHSFDWQPDALTFRSSTAMPSSWTYAGADRPQPGSEHVRINLWLYRGAPPTNGPSVEIIVKSFIFTAAR